MNPLESSGKPLFFRVDNADDSMRVAFFALLHDQDLNAPIQVYARDGAGKLAAATSTGGMTAKHPGRVGDSPMLGGGTWADKYCAVSGTGTGEVYIPVDLGNFHLTTRYLYASSLQDGQNFDWVPATLR